MSPEDKTPDAGTQTEIPPAAGASAEPTDDGVKPVDSSLSDEDWRVKRLNKEIDAKKTALDSLKTANEKLGKIEADQKLVREEKLKQDGKIQELLDDSNKLLEIAEAKAEKLDAYEAKRRDAILSTLPEESRAEAETLGLDALETLVKLVPGAIDNGGMTAAATAASNTDAPEPKSRKGMTTKELIASSESRRKQYLEKYGGMTVDQLRHPTRTPG